MADRVPVRKYVKVRFRRRRNKIKPGAEPTTSYTLYWREHGQKRFLSLGQFSTRAYAERMAREKEAELNAPQQQDVLKPAPWGAFIKDYLDQTYPGHDLPPAERKQKAAGWEKSLGTMKREQLAIRHFERIVKPQWCHLLTPKDRARYVNERLAEAGSALTVDAELRALRYLCNLMEEWKHRTENSNPFAGKGKASTGARRRRQKERAQEEGAKKEKHYTFEEIRTILTLVSKEAAEADGKARFPKKRLRVLVHFMAYTGCRINEAVHLEWQDIDWEKGVAWLFFKVENDLKTEGSQAPFGLPDKLLAILREWQTDPDRIDCS
jgi:integrase